MAMDCGHGASAFHAVSAAIEDVTDAAETTRRPDSAVTGTREHGGSLIAEPAPQRDPGEVGAGTGNVYGGSFSGTSARLRLYP